MEPMRLAAPIDTLGERYDAVVVGSGYGGAVCAARLSMAGWRVCVLERGREMRPGQFPETVGGLAAQVQIRTDTRRIGRPDRLMDLRLGRAGSVVLGCGLGGGSLINAGVVARPPAPVFDDPRWPVALRGDALVPFLDRAEHMLGAARHPEYWPRSSRAEALERIGSALGGRVERPPVTISFRAGANHVGYEQSACTLCGNCATGCNQGAKSTLATTYLPVASAHGARIFTGVDVRTVLPAADGEWAVSMAGRPGSVRARVVILAAGALGSTEILFRSRAAGLGLSRRLGASFSGNGGALAFCYGAGERIAGWGTTRPGSAAEPPGPTIAGMLRLADGRLIEDGVVPTALAELTAAALALRAEGRPGFTPSPRRILDILTRAHRDPADRTLMLLLVDADDTTGRLVRAAAPVGIRVAGGIGRPDPQALQAIVAAVGGRLVTDHFAGPTARVSVHPLGGAAMGSDGRDGVVDHRGRVFSGASADVHDGLHVVDGAIVPRALLANPLLTITALAERCAEAIVADAPALPRRASHPGPRPAVGLRFTERLRGHLGRNTDGDPAAGTEQGRADATPVELRLTLDGNSSSEWTVTGTAVAPALTPRRMRVARGSLRVTSAGHLTARYTLDLVADDGARFTLTGTKRIHAPSGVRAPWTLWRESTTLSIVVRERGTGTDRVLAAGTATIAVTDLVRQVGSLRVAPSPARLGGLAGVPVTARRPVALRGHRRALRLPEPRPRWCAGDGTWHAGGNPGPDAWLRLIRYPGGRRGPVMLAPGFSMSATSFLIDTVGENLVEHLVAAGYDVWLFDYRASIDLPSARSAFTIDDIASTDWPTAVAEVLRRTGRDTVHALGHCVGSLTLMMALAAGLRGVRSAICMQSTLHPVGSTLNTVKSGLPIGPLLRAAGRRHLGPARGGSLPAAVANALLRTVPAPPGERCGRAICDWVNALYGSTHRHARLNDATHEALGDLFDVGSLPALEQLARIVHHRSAVDAAGTDRYLAHPERLRLPITLVQGECNDIFRPAGSLRTLDWLTAANGPGHYDRIVLPGYAHLDALIGETAAADVYPLLTGHLDRHDGPPPKTRASAATGMPIRSDPGTIV